MENTAKLPAGLTVSLSDIEHGHSITATAQVSWAPIGETGGPLTVAVWENSLVVLTPSNSGTYPDLRFVVRGVGYSVRAEYRRDAAGAWELFGLQATRSDYVRFSDRDATPAARRALQVILAEVGRQIVQARPDLLLDAAVCETRKRANAATARVATLRAELSMAQDEARDAQAAVQAAELARTAAQECQHLDVARPTAERPEYVCNACGARLSWRNGADYCLPCNDKAE